MNSIVIEGRLTRDPEITTVSNGMEKARFSVAVDRRHRKDKEAVTDFFDCAAWNQSAAFVEQHFHKGDGICIRGRMESNRTEKDGVKVVYWTVNVDEISFPPGRKTEGNNTEAVKKDPESGFTQVDTDELPF